VAGFVGGFDRAVVADARAVVDIGVGVEHLSPAARMRQAQPVAGVLSATGERAANRLSGD
jgi:hypothetical protein